jgi:putative membrane protein
MSAPIHIYIHIDSIRLGAAMRVRAHLLTIVAMAAASLSAHAQEPGLERTPESRVASAMAPVSRVDRQFLQLAIDHGAKEVQLSQRALDKISDPQVKAFAQRIIEDHQSLNRELMALNERLLGEQGPPYKKASTEVKHEVEQLNALSGLEHDRRYMQVMMTDHQGSISLFAREAERGQDPALRALASKTVPVLKAHQESAREIWDQLREDERK